MSRWSSEGHRLFIRTWLLALLSGSLLVSQAFAGFLIAPTYPAGPNPYSVAVGDLNGDGKLNLAVANNVSAEPGSPGGTVSILLGNGDGTFQPPQSYAVGDQPQYVAVADFNGDGIPDLAVAVAGIASAPPTVSVLLGKGDGSFQAAQNYTVGASAASAVYLAIGDFNGDGFSDIAVAKPGNVEGAGRGVTILLNKGDGTFAIGQDYGFDFAPRAVAAADFDGDGRLDLAVAGGLSSLVILLGQGDGSFQAGQSYVAGADPTSIVVGDFNGDGHPDVAIGSGGVAVLLGNGDGTFQAAQNYGIGTAFVALALGDFNGDGHPDLVGVNNDANTVSVLLGKGDGTFQTSPVNYVVGPYPQAVAVGDFNTDGRLDLAVANSGALQTTPSVSILLGNGDGIFQTAQNYPLGGSSVAVADFNGDGIPDLAVAGRYDYSLQTGSALILLGRGDGTFQVGQTNAVGLYPGSVVVGDVNGDGIPDLVVANYGAGYSGPYGSVSVMLGHGDGTFGAAISFPAGSGLFSVALGDFNGDGKEDIVTANFSQTCDPRHPGICWTIESDRRIYLGNGDGTFQAGQVYPQARPASVAVGDFNGDGILDLAVGNDPVSGPGFGLTILLGNGDGTFQTGQSYALGASAVVVGDFNADGRLDLALANGSPFTGEVNVLLGNGDGTFQPAQSYAVGRAPLAIALGDFNGDGNPDLVVANNPDGTVSILLGNGDGTFRAAQSFLAGGGPRSLVVDDFNRDGFPDLAVLAGSGVTVLLNGADW